MDSFGNVFPPDFFFDGANLLRGHSVTAGCSVTPLNYCPNDFVSRGQMAIFVARSVTGGGATADNVTSRTTFGP